MIRYVHYEFRMAIAAWAALALTTGVVLGVRGPSSLPDTWWSSMAVFAVVMVLWVPLRASRIKGFGLVRELEKAEPRTEPYGTWPTDGFSLLQRRLLRGVLVLALVLVALVLPVSLWWEPWLIVGQLLLALDWTGHGLVAARWERRRGVLLWMGRQGRDPSEYYYTPVSSRPPTRTATDAPPG